MNSANNAGVSRFTTKTIDLLNLVMLVQSKGLNAGTMADLLQYSPPADFERQLLDDVVRKRNRHLLGGIRTWLSKSDDILVPWGAGQMPGIASEIQKAGFHLEGSQTYMVVQFFSGGGKREKSGR